MADKKLIQKEVLETCKIYDKKKPEIVDMIKWLEQTKKDNKIISRMNIKKDFKQVKKDYDSYEGFGAVMYLFIVMIVLLAILIAVIC